MGLAVVLFSSFVVGVTALSVSAICSNGRHLKGGVYYVVSRALGPQFGGVIAVFLIFYLFIGI
jgi:amino acid transporter